MCNWLVLRFFKSFVYSCVIYHCNFFIGLSSGLRLLQSQIQVKKFQLNQTQVGLFFLIYNCNKFFLWLEPTTPPIISSCWILYKDLNSLGGLHKHIIIISISLLMHMWAFYYSFNEFDFNSQTAKTKKFDGYIPQSFISSIVSFHLQWSIALWSF